MRFHIHRMKPVILVRDCEHVFTHYKHVSQRVRKVVRHEGEPPPAQHMRLWEAGNDACHGTLYRQCRCGERDMKFVSQIEPTYDPWIDDGVLPGPPE